LSAGQNLRRDFAGRKLSRRRAALSAELLTREEFLPALVATFVHNSPPSSFDPPGNCARAGERF
jgi:hypothetical protein